MSEIIKKWNYLFHICFPWICCIWYQCFIFGCPLSTIILSFFLNVNSIQLLKMLQDVGNIRQLNTNSNIHRTLLHVATDFMRMTFEEQNAIPFHIRLLLIIFSSLYLYTLIAFVYCWITGKSKCRDTYERYCTSWGERNGDRGREKRRISD